MKEGWTTRWKALFVWLCGYLNIVAFALVGGYMIVKSDDEELKNTSKKVLIVTLIFTAVSMFLSLYNNIGGMADNYYSSKAYSAYDIMSNITNIAKIVVFAVCAAISFFKKRTDKAQQPTEQKTEDSSVREEQKD
jgi:hypothetical protein